MDCDVDDEQALQLNLLGIGSGLHFTTQHQLQDS